MITNEQYRHQDQARRFRRGGNDGLCSNSCEKKKTRQKMVYNRLFTYLENKLMANAFKVALRQAKPCDHTSLGERNAIANDTNWIGKQSSNAWRKRVELAIAKWHSRVVATLT